MNKKSQYISENVTVVCDFDGENPARDLEAN